ncbi:pyridoxamine 5'-phosphate oxidase [Sediminibacterium sp.]|uniref:pyridoxamine 5'-phosphate oxidase n=1 Tax=Sediminibacterium sp. TaxID=1917865 RepID=UPI0027259016|nr:pyridoxamine 5'-phosphate oxidase [Sediminibacterium sp.]MDO9000420.1 pyridoxamine 5'-phosphate oxidase [Bacteroidota bacterium]MDP3147012.1 pyridoxamine 5'-phosphate oxidase [Bacteroidota bacterium]MDP3567451.1 pyridoxamine 5'-phosphate oxidase [Sediminibacterium sp.]
MQDLKNHITKLREDFTKGTLSESDVNKNPDIQFEKWLQQAVDSKVDEVQAMTLCTVSQEGKPSSRIVYLREFQNNSYFFYTNYNSKKAKQLLKNPNASISFFWPQLERQIIIEGTVEKGTAEQADAYYNNRPYDSKVGTWASNQSQKLVSRNELENKVEEIKKQFSPESIKRPDFWGGFVLKANYYEFWQGRKSRLHDRICYETINNEWIINRIAP